MEVGFATVETTEKLKQVEDSKPDMREKGSIEQARDDLLGRWADDGGNNLD